MSSAPSASLVVGNVGLQYQTQVLQGLGDTKQDDSSEATDDYRARLNELHSSMGAAELPIDMQAFVIMVEEQKRYFTGKWKLEKTANPQSVPSLMGYCSQLVDPRRTRT